MQFDNLYFREVVIILAFSIRYDMDPNAIITTQYERRAHIFTNTFREAHCRDPSDIGIRDHLTNFGAVVQILTNITFFMTFWKKLLN